jgi:NAD(P)-dependent dehydrogenase (short-subunit alcohol dehydrogenase family)
MMFATKFLQDQTAIITGGGTGIGLGIAKKYGDLGANVVIASRSEKHLAEALKELEARDIRALAVPTDVRDPVQVDNMIAKTMERFGRVDILVNNAAGNFTCLAENLSINGWNSVINIVLNGTFYCSRAAGMQMMKQNRGKILNIVATYAWTGGPGTIHSACAKAGVITMTQTLAVEWARYNIRVNAIAPGPIEDTGAAKLWAMPGVKETIEKNIPVRRFGTIEEMANLSAYLVSDMADFITGEVVVADGGAWLNKGVFLLAEE